MKELGREPEALRRERPPAPRAALAVVDFWRRSGPSRWFSGGSHFDAEFRDEYLELHEAAASRELAPWAATASGALALVILLDQFPRNAFRGTSRMYATDAIARQYAEQAIALGFDHEVSLELRLFFYLPFAHSEELADQNLSVALHEKLGYTRNARRHRRIIERFGRFPHRNEILGRTSTPSERVYLRDGGFAG